MDRNKLALVLNRYAEAKNRHDLDAIVSAYAPDGYYESVSLGGRTQGHEALRRFYAGLFNALPDYYGAFDGIAYNDDTAVVWGHFGGTTSGDMMGTKVPPGRKLEIPVTFVCKYRDDGLLLSDTGYFDAQTFLSQAGVSSQDLDAAAAAFVERFKSFWAAPTGARSAELIHSDAKVQWPGVTMNGNDLIAYFDNLFRTLPGLRLEVLDYASSGDMLFIHWRASAPTVGRVHSWTGVDRFVLRDGKAIEEQVNFDMASVREALSLAAAAE